MSSVKLVVHWICGLIAVMAYTYLICKISYAHGREEGSGGSQKPRGVNIIADGRDSPSTINADEAGGSGGYASASELYQKANGNVRRFSTAAKAMSLATTTRVRDMQRRDNGFTRGGSETAKMAREEARKKRNFEGIHTQYVPFE